MKDKAFREKYKKRYLLSDIRKTQRKSERQDETALAVDPEYQGDDGK